MNKPLDPMSVERTETPSASYVLRRRYGPARHVITVASWVTVISILFQPVAVLAATVTWSNGAGGYTWSTAGNWTGGEPGSGDNATFNSTGVGTLILSSGETALSLTFNDSYTLSSGGLTLYGSGGVSVSSGKTATITTPITVTGGLTKSGDGTVIIQNFILPNFGTVTLSGGTLKLVSSLPPAPITELGVSALRAYSLRKINSSYSGNAIEVRRSSDNTTQNIGFSTAGELDTAALLSFVGSGSGYVKTWYDQSGSGQDANQTISDSLQPQIVNAGTIYTNIGGKPTLYFNNANQDLVNPDCHIGFKVPITYTGSTINLVTVGQAKALGAGAYAYPRWWSLSKGAGGADYVSGIYADNDGPGNDTPAIVQNFWKPHIVSTIKPGANTTFVMNAWKSGSTANASGIRVNDTETMGTLDYAPNVDIDRGYIGTRNYFSNLNDSDVYGYISESILFTTLLDGTQRTTLANNQQMYYGIKTSTYANAVNLSTTAIAATASSILDLGASGADHTLGALSLTAAGGGIALTLGNAASVTFTGVGTVTTPAISVTGTGTASISAGTGTPSIKMAVNDTADVGTGATLTINPVIAVSGSLGLTKSGAGTLILSGANTYTGSTIISAGTLSVGNIVVSGGNSHIGNASTTVTLGSTTDQGILSYTGNAATYIRGFVIGGAGGGRLDVTTSGQTLTVGTGGVTGAGLFTVGGAGNTTINAVIGHTGGLTKEGAGTLTLASGVTHTYNGATTVNGGTLKLDGSSTLAGAVNVAGGTLEVTGSTGVWATSGFTMTGGALKLTGFNGSCSKVTSTGTVALGVNVASLTLVLSGTPTELEYILVSSGPGGLTGTFSSPAANSIIPWGGRNYKLTYTSTEVKLVLAPGGTVIMFK